MRDLYDIDEILELARDGYPAWSIQERLGLSITARQVNRLVKARLGPRPTRKSIERPNVLREAVVTYMESHGLHRRYCSKCQRRLLRDCAIHPLGRTLDDFVFVCVERCAAAGDF